MNKKNALQYIIAAAAFSIPSPARTAYGLILLLLFNILLLSLILTNYWVSKCNIEKYSKILQIIFAVAFTVFYKQLFTLYSPLHSLVLGIIFYIIPVSSLLTGFTIIQYTNTLSERLRITILESGKLSMLVFMFFILREYLAYGTISLPSQDGFLLLHLPSLQIIESGYFWASIPGALVLFSLFIIVVSMITRYKEIKWRKENTNV